MPAKVAAPIKNEKDVNVNFLTSPDISNMVALDVKFVNVPAHKKSRAFEAP